MGADFFLIPEMGSVGYTIANDFTELQASAVSSESAFAQIAKDLNMAVAVTYLVREEE
jgi:hypothetical protein